MTNEVDGEVYRDVNKNIGHQGNENTGQKHLSGVFLFVYDCGVIVFFVLIAPTKPP